MAAEAQIDAFLKGKGAIVDVRSPGEFFQGHIPGAYNIPLFSDAERALVGTLYKQQGKEAAVMEGLNIVGPKLHHIAEQAKRMAIDGSIRVHCWRGGMRSSSVAWLFETAGLKATTLTGGYKTFRRHALNTFSLPLPLMVIGGMTGSGKSAILQELKKQGEKVIDLEEAALHRGSAFGQLGMPAQPTIEQFENNVGLQLLEMKEARKIWVEDESRTIGRCTIPKDLYLQMQAAPIAVIKRPDNERMSHLLTLYGKEEAKEPLAAATLKLNRKLGSERTQQTIKAIEKGDYAAAVELLLSYYDKCYRFCLSKRIDKGTTLFREGLSESQWAEELLRLPFQEEQILL